MCSKPKQTKLSAQKRFEIIFLHNQGASSRKIASLVKCNQSTVVRIIKKYSEFGKIDDKPRSGRPKKTSVRDDAVLRRTSLADRSLNSTQLTKIWSEATSISVCTSTVRRKLISFGLRGCKARKKPLLSEKQRLNRLKWAREHLKWTTDQWQRVLFSDESTFNINNHAGNTYVRRFPGEEFSPKCIIPTIKHPTSVMVWGCMSSRGVGRLHIISGMMNATKYIDVLQNKMLRSGKDLFGEESFQFQDDNAPCHRAKLVKSWMETNGIIRLDWPAQSPDLNPIENLWNRISNIISRKKPTTKVTLIESLIDAWHHCITRDELEKLVNSMPKRCQLVIKNKGWPIKY